MRSPRRWLLALLLLVVPFAVACGTPTTRNPYQLRYASLQSMSLGVERYRLPNGLEVLLDVDHTTPFVAVDLRYHVGGKDDPPGRAGFAHLFEHLMFDGSKHVGQNQHLELLDKADATDVNARTSADDTEYHETVPTKSLELALWLESERMAFLLDALNQDELDRERRVVENELRQNYLDAPYGQVWPLVFAEAYPEPHPYHHMPIGSLHDLDATTLDDVRAFFRTYYVPNNCTLALVGDFDKASAKELVERTFGTIAPGAPPPPRPDVMPSPLAEQRTIRIEADVPRPRLLLAYPTVARYAMGTNEL